MPRELEIRTVDAFTDRPFGGNAAGVVTRGGENLDDARMQALAREMNLSETAFLLPATRADADLRIRWFTPGTEVPLCGHATIAAFHAAAEEGSWGLDRDGTHVRRLECLSGVLRVTVEKESGRPPRVTMALPDPVIEPWEDTAPACEALRLARPDLASGLPAARCGFYLLLPLSGLDAMRAVAPDLRAIAALTLLHGGDGLILVSLETIDPESAVHVRMFAPAAAVDEDPVTGSAQSPVAGWLALTGFFSGREGRYRRVSSARVAYTAEQGDLMGRPGRIEVGLDVGDADPAAARDITISGRAVTMVRGRLSL
jgi:trans-2,3-dihydro-3-hydroxyanthranilate isomerase